MSIRSSEHLNSCGNCGSMAHEYYQCPESQPSPPCELYDIHSGEYVGPATELDVMAYKWYCQRARPWILRDGRACRVEEVKL
jgi:hypothetical protein